MLTVEEARTKIARCENRQWELRNLAATASDPTLLGLLAEERSAQVKRAVAANPATPGDILHNLITSRAAINVTKAAVRNTNVQARSIDYVIDAYPAGDNRLMELIAQPNLTSEQITKLFPKLNQPNSHITGNLIGHVNFPDNLAAELLNTGERFHIYGLANRPTLSQEGFMYLFRSLPELRTQDMGQTLEILTRHNRTPNQLFALLGFIQTTPNLDEELKTRYSNNVFAHANFPIGAFSDYLTEDRYLWGFAMNPNITPEFFDYIMNHALFPAISYTGETKVGHQVHHPLRHDYYRTHRFEQQFLSTFLSNPGLTDEMKMTLVRQEKVKDILELFLINARNLPDAVIYTIFEIRRTDAATLFEYAWSIPRRVINRLRNSQDPLIAAAANQWQRR